MWCPVTEKTRVLPGVCVRLLMFPLSDEKEIVRPTQNSWMTAMTTQTRRTAEKPGKREELPIVFVTRTRCPKCGECNLKTLRSHKESDGSVTRRTYCRECGAKFDVVLE